MVPSSQGLEFRRDGRNTNKKCCASEKADTNNLTDLKWAKFTDEELQSIVLHSCIGTSVSINNIDWPWRFESTLALVVYARRT